MKTVNAPERVYVAVDVMSIWHAVQDSLGTGYRINYERLINFIQNNRRNDDRIISLNAYIITVSTDLEISQPNKCYPKNTKFIKILEDLGYSVKNRVVCQDPGPARKWYATDWIAGISIDALCKLKEYDTFCLVSGSGDYSMLINNLKEHNKYVEIITTKGREPRILSGKADRILTLTQYEMYIVDWAAHGKRHKKTHTNTKSR
jgi:hypothetical protein